jgi:twitching motility protein PilT
MQTFDQALLKHFQAGRISMEDALRIASSPHDFKLLVAAEGRTSTSMDDLMDASERSSAGPETLRNPVPVGAPPQRNGAGPPSGHPAPPPASQN